MHDLAYILSPSYSGSTLLTLLLGAHPDVATIGELKASANGDVDVYRCSCGALIRQCPFWRKVQDQLSVRGTAFDLANFGTRFRCPDRPLLDRVLRAGVRGGVFEILRRAAIAVLPEGTNTYDRIMAKNQMVTEAVRDIQGGRVFLDDSKDPNRLLYLYRSRRWRIHVIRMIRDGRGVSNSFMKHESIDMPTAALRWKQKEQECDRALALLPPGASLRLRYEDLCGNPEGTLRDIFRFVGVDPSICCSDFASVEHHVLGNSMRLRSCSEIKPDSKWRQALSAGQLAVFDRVAGNLNRSYGYR